MRRYIGYAFMLIALLTFFVWAVSQFIRPILPSSVNGGLVLFFAAFLSVVGFLAGFKDTIELFRLFSVKPGPSEKPFPSNYADQAKLPEVSHSLPQPDYENFIGRQAELDQVHRLLRPYPNSRHFVISVDGIGGIGKSALALEVANYYLLNYAHLPTEERFDAIIWASAKRSVLTGEGEKTRPQALHTIDDIYTSIAIALERKVIVRAPAGEQDELARQALTQQRTLLIIDNLETVDDERVRTFVREVPAPTKVIVTTRHRLDIAFPVRLKGMDRADALALIADESTEQGITLTDDESQRLYERTGGVPLAIVWSIAQMGFGYGIDNVLTRLGQPSSDIAQFCFEGAIELVRGKPAYCLLMVLSLFTTDASRVALGYVAGLPQLDLDEGLVELEKLSLVNKRGDRFQMLPLTLAYAKAQLAQDSELEAELRGRWLQFLLRFLDEQGQQYENLAKVKPEMENILGAMDWCLSMGKSAEFIGFLDRMNFYLWATGSWNSWNRYLTLGPEKAASLDEVLTQADFLGWLASMRYYQDSLDEAQSLIEQAISIYRIHKNKSELSLSLRRLASIKIKRGEYENARRDLEQALMLAQEANSRRYISRIQRQLAKLDMIDGELDVAKRRLNEARALRETEIQLSSGLAYIYRLLGQISFRQRDYESSRQSFQRSLEIGTAISSQHDMAEAKLGLAGLELMEGRLYEAKRLVQEAIEVLSKLGMKRELREARALLEQIETRSGS